MKANHFTDRLSTAVLQKDSRVCVGLDPNLARLPQFLLKHRPPPQAVEHFCCAIIDAVAEHCVAVKPQAAYFEMLREAASPVLWSVMRYAQQAGLLVILDAKRNDIGSTADAYARARNDIGSTADAYARAYLCDDAPVDAITVNPYLGSNGVIPFVKTAAAEARGLFVLTKTSNPSSGELQDLRLSDSGKLVYQQMADLVADWGDELVGEYGYSAVGAVVGATYPQQLAELRARMPQTPLLVPGYGTQGATAQDVAAAFDKRGLGAIINSSRGIIFAYEKRALPPTEFAQAAQAATVEMKNQINSAIEQNAG